MSEQNGTPALGAAIKANLGALADLRERAASDARAAFRLVEANERNAAIGTIVGLDRLLADAVALRGAALALHRRARE